MLLGQALLRVSILGQAPSEVNATFGLVPREGDFERLPNGLSRVQNPKRKTAFTAAISVLSSSGRHHKGKPMLEVVFRITLSLLLVFTAARAGADEIKIGGAGPAVGTMRLLGEAYTRLHPLTKVNVLPSLGSAGGVRAAVAGAIDIGVSSVPLTDVERSTGASQIELARIPFFFAVATSNPVTGVTTEQLVAIYSGKTRRWPDGARIRLVLRPPDESDTAIVKGLSPEMRQALTELESKPGMLVPATAQDTADAIERIPGALGTTSMNLVVTEKRAIRPLKLNGIEPSAGNVANGRYPLYKPILLILGPKTSSEARDFIAFLRSPSAREILVQTGHAVSDSEGSH